MLEAKVAVHLCGYWGCGLSLVAVMCSFKPGERVVAIKSQSGYAEIVVGAEYTVRDYGPTIEEDGRVTPDDPTLWLVEVSWDFKGPGTGGYEPLWFRKVERKGDSLSIEAFLTIKPGQHEEPKRSPAKKREKTTTKAGLALGGYEAKRVKQ